MALPGLRSTNDMGTDGRPKNWREGLLLGQPRNKASLFALTAAMRSEPTDDPEFYWWEEPIDMLTYQMDDTVDNSSQAFEVKERATRLKPGDMLRIERTGEAIRVLTIVDDENFTATRGVGNTSPAAVQATDVLLYVGSAYAEGAGKPTGTSYNPTKNSNVTQIFRDPVEWTRTAMKTRLRYTSSIEKEDRRRAMHKHGVGIERAFWLGKKFETVENGQPLRFTGGLMDFIPNDRKKNVNGTLDADTFFSYIPDMFAYGSNEKLAFASIRILSFIGEMVRKNASYEWGPRETEYGMNVKRLYGPAGTLVLTEHPLFGQEGAFLSDGLVVLDTENIRYRYITDTTHLKDREPRGTDGKAEEYLTEAGLEYHHAETFTYLYGITGAAKDAE